MSVTSVERAVAPFRALQTRSPRVHTGAWAYFVYALIIGAFVVTVYWQLSGVLPHILPLLAQHSYGWLIAYPSLIWTVLGLSLLGLRTFFWAIYRPMAPAVSEEAPSITVIIPAYNEGAMVLNAIESVVAADYPRDRIEVIAIDDGSKDDTWEYISAAAQRYPGLVTALRQDRNRGKREAMALAISRARGDVFVTVDSDSVIERDALLAIVAPFRNPKVGAVAGKVLVYNRRRGIIPRMLHVRFILSFDLLRASESAFGNVYCCPGALTALRADAVRRVLGRWLDQQFLGVRCTFGEDRAMTNLLFLEGYDSVYQQNAVVHTEVPEVFPKLCKMFLRWERSYVREEFQFLRRIVWQRPLRTRVATLLDRSVANMRYPVIYASLASLPIMIWNEPSVFPRLMLGMGLGAALSTFHYLRSERSFEYFYAILYSYFWLFALFWIFPYALVTARARSWMTR
jgi:hyaluronan synthase